MFDMKRAPIKESLKPTSVGSLKPDPYAYEHRVTLNSADMGKLGVDAPKVGDVFHLAGEGHVVDSSQTESQNGEKAHTVSLQLKKMALKKKGGASMLDAVSKGVQDAQGE
jgi:hypothetical protein